MPISESGLQRKPSIHPVAKRLMTARLLRSIGQGIMIVDLALYLKALNWSATAIGVVLTTGGLVSIVLVLLVGVLSDRLGRKPFLVFYELITAGCALTATVSSAPVLLFIAIVLAGFGRGQSGTAGPFAPAEQAWLAAFVPQSRRGSVYSINSAFGFFGMGFGSLLAGGITLWNEQLSGALAYRPFFALIFILSLITAVLVACTRREEIVRREKKENKPVTASKRAEQFIQSEKSVVRRENHEVFKLAGVNMINGIAVGLTGPLMSYWLAVKFGVSATEIGSTLSITFFCIGLASILQGRLSDRLGMVRSVVWMRVVGAALIFLIPILPTYFLVSIVYIIRSALNRGTIGARQALSVSLTRGHRRGFSTSVSSLSMNVTTSAGPTVSGYLIEAGALAAPFYVGGVLQLSFAILYGRLFRSYDHTLDKKNQSA